MANKPNLKRTLSLSAMASYGLGNIIGAGAYVLIRQTVRQAGAWGPFSFVIDSAFRRRWLTALVGWSVVLTGVVSAA
jgi:amino acid permease